MSSKTRTRKPRTTATTATTTRALRSVPDRPTTATARTDTEDKLWAELHTNPNSTAADLSAAATIGKSTAQKILVKWESDGSVTRTAGIAEGGRRAADLWAIVDTTDAAPDSTVDGGNDSSTTNDTPADDGTVQDTAPADPAATVAAPPAEENVAESGNADSGDPAADNVQDTATTTADDEPEDAQDPTADPAPTKTEPADAEPEAAVPTEGSPTPDATETASDGGKTERLAPGALRGQVEDWLREHPDEQAGPTKIAKDLGGKSSGAVSNALDKLVTDGVAVKTQDKPRRFGLAPAQREATASPAN